MLHGHDVSNYQGEFNWEAVKATDAFGICKATEGTSYLDAQFSRNWAQLKTHGLRRGAYHFGHPGLNSIAQAQYFVDTVNKVGLEANDALCLDLEVTDGLRPTAVAGWAQTFVGKVHELSGKNCWVYADFSFIRNGCCNGLYGQPLWVASYTDAGAPGDVRPWQVWSLQQYGIVQDTDADVLNGDAATWDALVNTPQPPPRWVLAKQVTDGSVSLSEWCARVGQLPSTTLRMTAEHSLGDLYTSDVAAWLNGVFEGKTGAEAPMPKGMTLWYMKAA